MQTQADVPVNGFGILARIYWMFLGNVLLLFLLALLFTKAPSFPSLLDAAYGGVVVSLILVRFVDIRWLKGETGEGQPATLTHWRRYTILLGSVGIGAWLLARGLAHSLT